MRLKSAKIMAAVILLTMVVVAGLLVSIAPLPEVVEGSPIVVILRNKGDIAELRTRPKRRVLSLKIEYTNIDRADFESIAQACAIAHLDIHDCQNIGSGSLSQLRHPALLTRLNVSGTGIGPDLGTILRGMRSLEYLDCSDTSWNSFSIPPGESWPKLTQVNCRGCQLSSPVLKTLAQLPSLEILDISLTTGLMLYDLELLASCPALTTLHTVHLQIDQKTLGMICSIPSLRNFQLLYPHGVGAEDVETARRDHPHVDIDYTAWR